MATNPQIQAPWGEYVPRVGRMTVEQFESFPAEEGWSYELHEGRLISTPGPGTEHAHIQALLFNTLGNYLIGNQLGILFGTGCYNLPLPGNTEEVLCPDLSYVVPARLATMTRRGSYLVGVPDLVIEIASPSDTHPEVAATFAVYLRAGVRLAWVLWPRPRTVDLWRSTAPTKTLSERDTLDGLDVIPGFQCTVGELFPA